MKLSKRRKTLTVCIGSVKMGNRYPIVIQSMTNTPTADVTKTYAQTVELIKAGSELVRWTVNDENAALAVPRIVAKLRRAGYQTPIIGDFHYNGHILLQEFPDCANALDKYRINPGNVGKGSAQDKNFEQIIRIAMKYKKAVRIGVNSGSLDQNVLAELLDQNAKRKNANSLDDVLIDAMVKSATESARLAEKIGLPKNKIVLSVKMSQLQSMVSAYQKLAKECDHVLHLGLTEAGGDLEGISSSSAALAILLQQGIGDTIRVSLTPQPGYPRSREVEVCKALLQSLGLRHFEPRVISCPGCGRTSSEAFQKLAQDVKGYIKKNIGQWQKNCPGVENMTVAVMGCVVNGPGEGKHADIGISLPGASEKSSAIVFVGGKRVAMLTVPGIKEKFLKILDEYVRNKFKKKGRK